MIVGFDFETELIAPGRLAPAPVCLSHASEHGSGLYHARFQDELCEAALDGWLAGDGELVGARTQFDAAVAMARWPSLVRPFFRAYGEGRVLDVQLNQRLADLARGRLEGFEGGVKLNYSLADLVLRLLGRDRSAEKSGPDVWRLRYGGLAAVPLHEWPEAAVAYPIRDAEDPLLILEKQLEFAELWADDAQAQARHALVLHLEACRGFHSDGERIKKLADEARAKFLDVTSVLVAEKLVRGNKVPKKAGTRDTKAAKRRMVAACRAAGVDVKLTETGWEKAGAEFVPSDHPLAEEYPALDEEACGRVSDPVLEKYAERVKLVTLLRTHVPDLERGSGDEPLQPKYKTLLETGRVSCKKDRNLNGLQVQNQGRDGGTRECVRARDGHLFVQADFGGQELAAWAQVCMKLLGWSSLGDALNAGRDPHLEMAGQLLGVPYDEVLARKRDHEVKEARQDSKPANFGFPGGMGAEAFVSYARGMGRKFTLERAQEIRGIWRDTWPEHAPYFAWAQEQVEAGGAIVQLYSGRRRGGCRFTQVANGMFQALGADGSLRGHWHLSEACYADATSILYRVTFPVLFVHDEVISETVAYRSLLHASRAERQEVASRAVEVSRLLERGCNEFLPDVPVKCPPTLGRWWSKKTMDEPVYDADGILVPLDLALEEGVPTWYADGKAVR